MHTTTRGESLSPSIIQSASLDAVAFLRLRAANSNMLHQLLRTQRCMRVGDGAPVHQDGSGQGLQTCSSRGGVGRPMVCNPNLYKGTRCITGSVRTWAARRESGATETSETARELLRHKTAIWYPSVSPASWKSMSPNNHYLHGRASTRG